MPRGSYSREGDWVEAELDLLALTVPPGERPSQSDLPGSIEEAVLRALEQVPGSSVAEPPGAGAPRGQRRPR